jgi:general secretion pathway protein G
MRPGRALPPAARAGGAAPGARSSRPRGAAGLTLVELLVTIAILSILAAMVLPIAKVTLKREKELELRRALRTMREAIDEYKRYSDQGLIQKRGLRSQGYPEELEILVEGVPQVGAIDKKLRFLRRVPIDPMTGEAVWGLRSTNDDPESTSWGGQNVFDVYSLSPGTALDGSKYSDW